MKTLVTGKITQEDIYQLMGGLICSAEYECVGPPVSTDPSNKGWVVLGGEFSKEDVETHLTANGSVDSVKLISDKFNINDPHNNTPSDFI